MPDKNREDSFQSVSKILATLSYRLKNENFAGMNSLNSLVEDVLVPVLKVLLKASDLENANASASNTERIDLIAPASRIGVQVTTETAASKVTDTLSSFAGSIWDGKIDRLIFVILSPERPGYRSESRAKWRTSAATSLAFEPDRDVWDGVPRLLLLIKALDDGDLRSIERSLASSVLGIEYIDVSKALKEQSERQLSYEKESLKYIPELFAETPKAKDMARYFAHPGLFFNRLCDQIGRWRITGFSATVQSAGLAPPTLPDPAEYRSDGSFQDSLEKANRLASALLIVRAELERLTDISTKTPPLSASPTQRRNYLARIWSIRNGSSSWMSLVDDLINEIACVTLRVLIFTSPAGQGKTMFVCDLVENTMHGQQIPSAFLTGNYVSRHADKATWEVLFDSVFQRDDVRLERGLELLNQEAMRRERPVVIVIDALNEHRNTTYFAQDLHRFISESLRFSHIRFLLTCRTEFFERRFAELAKPPVSGATRSYTNLDHLMPSSARSQMVENHYRFFQLEGSRIEPSVTRDLGDDRILLRLFCEVYGERTGGPQPEYLRSIHRLDVFEAYLKLRLSDAEKYRDLVTGRTMDGARRKMQAALSSIVRWMVDQRSFVDVPIEVIPSDSSEVVEYLLSEEIILRRELSTGSVLSSDEAISFTFDEFRDFLLTDYLAHTLFRKNPGDFLGFIVFVTGEARPVAEGVRRFMFHVARKPGSERLRSACDSVGFFDPVFPTEVFNLDPALLTQEDVSKVHGILNGSDSPTTDERDPSGIDDASFTQWERERRAHQVAMHLIRRWQAETYPFLNLDLLSDSTYKGGVGARRGLIEGCFDPRQQEHYDLNDVCERLIEIASNEFGFNDRKPTPGIMAILRLLVLMVPLGATVEVSSPAFGALRRILFDKAEVGVSAITEGLRSDLVKLRPFLWRLAFELTSQGADFRELSDLARSHTQISVPGVRTQSSIEAKRFLTLIKSKPDDGGTAV